MWTVGRVVGCVGTWVGGSVGRGGVSDEGYVFCGDGGGGLGVTCS